MRNTLVALLTLCTTASAVSAQTFTGRVAGGGKPLKGAAVTLLGSGGQSMLCFVLTGTAGEFSISVPDGKKADALLFSHLGYARDTIPVSSFRQGQTVSLTEQALRIKEIRVRAPRISESGDTLSYMANSFRQKQDRSIADVIRKMPGLHVNGDGTIEYQGTQINKFYIEGMDVLGSKYSQASENISADKVKAVQVIRNHEPVKVRRGISFSDQAALNIVLTDDAKNVWQGTADIGMGTAAQQGTDLMGDTRLTAMMFARRLQSISMYKYDNTGKDIIKEVADRLTHEDNAPTEEGMLRNISTGTPSLEARRTTFNNSHALATNWLFKTKGGNDLRLQAGALHDKSDQRQRRETFYTDVTGGTVTAEDVEAVARRSEMWGELTYKVNNNRTYLVNTLKGYAEANRSNGKSVLNGKTVGESVKPRKRYVSDTFGMTRRMSGGRSISVSSYLSYNSLPGSLMLADSTWQRLRLQSVHWGAETCFRHRLGSLHVTYTASAKGRHQKLEAMNEEHCGTDMYDEMETRLTPSVSWQDNILKVRVSIPVAWLTRSLGTTRRSTLITDPSISISAEPTANWQANAGYTCSHTPAGLTETSPMPIFTDYITMRQGSGCPDYTRSHALSGHIAYKNTIKGLFASAYATWIYTGGIRLGRSTLEDGIYRNKATETISGSHLMNIYARIAKSFSRPRLNAGLSAFHTENRYSLMLESVTPCRMKSTALSADISIQPAEWLSAEAKSHMSITGQENRRDSRLSSPTQRSFSHEINLYVMPGNWQIEWRNEMYHSSDGSVSANFFSDLSVSYRKKTYEAGLSIDNIFGNDKYDRRTITTTQRIYAVSRLRPRCAMLHVALSL